MSTAAHKPLAVSTITALRAIAAAVLENPETYNQRAFLSCPGTNAECGCIAYQYLKMTRTARQFQNLVKKEMEYPGGFLFSGHPFFKAVQKELGLGAEQARLLLGAQGIWPTKYWDKYITAKTYKGRARVLASYIEFFIKTDGTCLTARESKLAA